MSDPFPATKSAEQETVDKLAAAGFLSYDPATEDSEWETLTSDNGTVMEWRVGTVTVGRFVDLRQIELPVEQRRPDQQDDPMVDILVFEVADASQHKNVSIPLANGERWFTWVTYGMQPLIAENKFVPGAEYRFEVKAERKSKAGNVKIFDIKRRRPKPSTNSDAPATQ